MGGGLMQLVAYGAQDVYLSGNPQITFFKVVYRRHTNFSVEPIQQVWNGVGDFGRTVTCNINRNGDLITNMYVSVLLDERTPDSTRPWGYVNRLGHAMIKECKVEIGGSKIDEQYGDWLNIWYELTHKVGQERGYAKMIGDVDNLTNVSSDVHRNYQMYVPLQFWFNRNNGLALPLIALQYHDVRVTVEFRSANELVNYNITSPLQTELPAMKDCYLLIDYVYLDSEERKRFAQASHEYLIEQLQFTGSETLNGSNQKYRLNFNHPSKYLVWAPQLERHYTRTNWVSCAFDGNWTFARDRFAKIIAAASSSSLDVTTGSSGTIKINLTSSPTVGDLVSTTLTKPSSSGITAAMLDKIDVKFVALAASDVTTTIAQGATDLKLAQSLLDNAVVTRNELTMEDISQTLSQLQGTGSGDYVSLLTLFTQSVVNYHNYGNLVDGTDNPVSEAKLQLNGHDRFQERDGHYFNYVQPYQHFSNTPVDGVNVYSFALKAEEHQPSGTCNFSRIDNATLQVKCGLYNDPGDSNYITNFVGGSSSNSLINIYTVNYNVLRVMSGMAGTAYSN
jgi:hypothetical protein